jgi:hypothetical protein
MSFGSSSFAGLIQRRGKLVGRVEDAFPAAHQQAVVVVELGRGHDTDPSALCGGRRRMKHQRDATRPRPCVHLVLASALEQIWVRRNLDECAESGDELLVLLAPSLPGGCSAPCTNIAVRRWPRRGTAGSLRRLEIPLSSGGGVETSTRDRRAHRCGAKQIVGRGAPDRSALGPGGPTGPYGRMRAARHSPFLRCTAVVPRLVPYMRLVLGGGRACFC